MNVRHIFATLALAGCIVMVPPTAQASETVDCTETENYYLAVIGNYQAEVERLGADVAYWHAADDRVAARAVERNFEYAAVVQQNQRLRYRIGTLRSRVADLREALREERAK